MLIALPPPPQDVAPPPGVTRIAATIVEERADSLIGLSDSAGEGLVGAEQLASRPLSRPGEVLEFVPGVIVTQHSGAGKANQFFLRGFNLDHGTDLLTSFERVPVNLPSHGHGQGYTDLNFLIPELLERVEFRKGPYFADVGDFASAGHVELRYVDRLERGLARTTLGEDGYARALAADSFRAGAGDLLVAAEAFHDDGPWSHPDDYRRFNGVAKWSSEGATQGASVTFLGMDGEWDATDQIPRRAVKSGTLGRFDSLDESDGGEARRATLLAEWHARDARGASEVTLHATRQELDLWSNFTYFLDDPVNGDQFEQRDERTILGLDARRTWFGELGALPTEHSLGLQLRHDSIDNGLYRTRRRSVLATTREDEIEEPSAGFWYANETQWSSSVRTTAGLRGDVFAFDVDSDNPANSGDDSDALASAKLGAVFGPWSATELFLDLGQGFHSNDARGVLTRDDPATPAPSDATPVDPLVRTQGAEIGVRTNWIEGLHSTLSLWVLDSDSEILFVGDAGSTTASRPSRRFGVEFANAWKASDSLALDADVSWSHARFRDDDPAGDRIPGAIETVVAAGATWTPREELFASVRARYFGPRDLIEDGSERSSESLLVHVEAGWRIGAHWSLEAGVFNVFDERANDIEYVYDSRLPGEPAQGVSDVHFHPAQGRTLRVGLGASW